MENSIISILPRMKTFVLIFMLCNLFYLSGCDKGKDTTAPISVTPLVLATLDVANVTTQSVVLSGEITSPNNETIVDVGFIFIRDYQSGVPNKEIEISLGKQVKAGEAIKHTYLPAEKFSIGDIHAYCLYVKTEKSFYKGALKTFNVDGLVVDHHEIFLATIGEKITLTGDFSPLDNTYNLALNGKERQIVSYVLNDTKTSLSFDLPSNLNALHGDEIDVVLVKLKYGAAELTRSLAKVSILATILPPIKKRYALNDQINLSGTALPAYGSSTNGLQLLINGKPMDYQPYIAVSSLLQLQSSSFQIGYKNGRDSIIFPDPIEINMPDLSTLTYKSSFFHPFSYISTSPFLFYNYFGGDAQYFLDQYPMEPRWADGIYYNFFIEDVPEGSYNFKAKTYGYTFEMPGKVNIKKLSWTAIPTDVKAIGDKVRIKGNFIPDFQYVILLDGGSDNYYYGQDGYLDVDITPLFVGRKQMEIGYYSMSGTFISGGKQWVETTDFKIDKAYPLKGYPGEIITIEGKGIKFVDAILFGNHVIPYPTVINDNKIQVTAPNLPVTGQVRMSISVYNKLYQYPDYFELL